MRHAIDVTLVTFDFCHPSGVRLVWAFVSGGIAALNPRLLSDNPSGCLTRRNIFGIFVTVHALPLPPPARGGGNNSPLWPPSCKEGESVNGYEIFDFWS